MIARAGLAAVALLATAADDPLAGRVAGPAVDCIDVGIVSEVRIVDRGTIIYQATPHRLWRTAPDGACPDLEPSATLIVLDQLGRRLCRGDRFRVRREGIAVPGGVCRFAAFTPYDRR